MVFGMVFPLVGTVLGLLVRLRFDAPGARNVLWIACAALTFVYLAVPGWRWPIFIGWMYATYPMGWILSHVVLLIVFFLVIVPFGLVVRLARRDPLARRVDRTAETYWVRRSGPSDVRRYFRQS